MQQWRQRWEETAGLGRACIVFAFLMAHGAAVLWFPGSEDLASAPFQVAVALLPVAGCLAALRKVPAPARPGWAYLAIALVMTGVNTLVCLWVYRVQRLSYDHANISDFLYIFNYIFLVLAVTWSREEAAGTWFFCFDAAQALIGTLLSYILLFDALPFSAQPPHPLDATSLVRTFDIMNMALVVAAVMRMVGRRGHAEQHQFERRLALFIITFEPIMCLYNHVFGSQPGIQDILIDIPFLLLWVQPAIGGDQIQAPDRRRPIALVVDSIGPAFCTAIVVCLGVAASYHRPLLGTSAILLAIILSALRGALTQSRYIRAQQDLRAAHTRMEEISLLDELTGVANRRRFDIALRAHLEVAQRSGGRLALLMVDVDHFKMLNDRQGHLAGDRCLRQIAQALSASVSREADMVARYGGEEFAVLLPATEDEGARIIARHLIAAVQACHIPNHTPIGDVVTVSVGLASYRPDGARTTDALIDAADRALYQAKQGGRNCLRWTEGASSPCVPAPIL